jgi:glucose/arabinose dehydrogenase
VTTMRLPFTLPRTGFLLPAAGALAIIGTLLTRARPEPPRHAERPVCAPDNGGLTVAEGFCALVVAHGIGPVRHLVVAPNGDIFVNRESGGVLALRDTSGDGVADVTRQFGRGGGTGIALEQDFLYYATDDAVYRYPWRAGQLEPESDAEPIVTGLPAGGDHHAKSIALGSGGALFVNIGSATNSCQQQNRASRSPGRDPCNELSSRAGVWRFAADKRGQRFADGERWATGLRNTVALAAEPGTRALYGATHSRDQLAASWGFSPAKNAENPGEELVRIERGDDYGWPYCYFDMDLKRNVLAPEYGGDGKQAGRCTAAKPPLTAYPGHWAPMAIAFGPARQLGPAYGSGMFIAFHGSWNRAPLPQAGYRVVWQPEAGGRPAGDYQTFVTGAKSPTAIRPSGLAVGPDGSLYLAADENQTVWRILNAAGAERTREGT